MGGAQERGSEGGGRKKVGGREGRSEEARKEGGSCLLYTSDAADEVY